PSSTSISSGVDAGCVPPRKQKNLGRQSGLNGGSVEGPAGRQEGAATTVKAAARRKPMARTHARPAATLERHLAPVCDHCWSCGRALWFTDTNRRTVTTLAGLVACTPQLRS